MEVKRVDLFDYTVRLNLQEFNWLKEVAVYDTDSTEDTLAKIIRDGLYELHKERTGKG